MAYDERLAERIRRALGQLAGSTEKKMFGGLAFLLGGKMCCGIVMDTWWCASGLSATSRRSVDLTCVRWTLPVAR
jgi:hypothetical protein